MVTKRLFREGGPHQVRHLGGDQYHLSVTIPRDSDGRCARECPNEQCSPGYFKVMPGTGITRDQDVAFCPYCRHEAEANDFTTQEQIRYAKDIAMREVQSGIDDMIKDALGLDSSGKKRLGSGLISIEMSYKPGSPHHVRRPYEDEIRRDVVCPHCTLDQTVFGLATWCSDCGENIFLTHVAAELSVLRTMLTDIERREHDLGKRVAAKDLENCLEDAVSIFEASTKAMVRRALVERGDGSNLIDMQMKRIGNSFQNTNRSKEQLLRMFAYTPSEQELWKRLEMCFEKRHPITHNLGVVDRKYLERAQQAEREGREIRVTEREVGTLLDDVYSVIADIHQALFSAHG